MTAFGHGDKKHGNKLQLKWNYLKKLLWELNWSKIERK